MDYHIEGLHVVGKTQSRIFGISVTLIKELNIQLNAVTRAKATINKYGHKGLADSLEDITKFNAKVFKKNSSY